MSRIKTVNPEETTGVTKELLDGLRKTSTTSLTETEIDFSPVEVKLAS